MENDSNKSLNEQIIQTEKKIEKTYNFLIKYGYNCFHRNVIDKRRELRKYKKELFKLCSKRRFKDYIQIVAEKYFKETNEINDTLQKLMSGKFSSEDIEIFEKHNNIRINISIEKL
jgi:hypothetical protein